MVMIYIHFIELYALMLHAKFQNHRPSGSGEEDFKMIFLIYSHGGHLCHETWINYINFHPLFIWMLHVKFGFDWSSGFRQKMKIMVIYFNIAPEHEQNPPGAKLFTKTYIFCTFAHS